MGTNGGVTAVRYAMEWEDHLFEVYADFGRRNNINEWIYFFRRPEFAIPETHDKIATCILQYMIQHGNISQDVVKCIESTFHYAEKREMYEKIVGYEGMETYVRYLLSLKEFPPFDLFGEYEAEKQYDLFIDQFREIYFTFEAEDAEQYREKLDELKQLNIYHPYLAFLDSEYYLLCGAWQSAVRKLKGLEDGYHKFVSLGFLFAGIGDHDIAEECFEKAMQERETNLDPALVVGYIMSKWKNNKEGEALLTANRLAEEGYEPVVLPVKQVFLDELGSLILEKSKEQELTEGELLILKEWYKLYGKYDLVAELGKVSWQKGFTDESWTVDTAEAYFELGRNDEVQRIIDMVYGGRKKLTSAGRNKIREIKGRLLFDMGRVEDAYDILESLCKRPESTMKQQFHLAKMYLTTRKTKPAMDILRHLRYAAANNYFYTYELARCFMQVEDWETAHILFKQVFSEIPQLERVAFYMVQCAIDLGVVKQAEEELQMATQHLSTYERRYLEGQVLELQEKYKAALDVYKNLVMEYRPQLFPAQLLHDSYVRYFLMQEETGGKVGPMLKELKTVLEKFPDAVSLWLYRAAFHEQTGTEEESIEHCCQMALKADPFNQDAMLRLASIYADREDWKRIWELSNKMICFMELETGYLLRAQSGYCLGNTEQCASDLEKFLQLGGDENQAREVQAVFAMEMGLYEEALAYYEEKLEHRDVSEVPCYDDLAVCLCKLGRFEEASDLLDTVCEGSKYRTFHVLLYRIQLYMGDFSSARATLKRYQKMFKINRVLDDDYSCMSAQLLMEAGKLLQAQNIASSIASLDGECLCGMLEVIHMNFGKAIKVFRKLVQKQPEEIDYYSWLAFALYFNGAQLEASSVARQGLSVFGNLYGNIADVKRADRLCQYAFLKTLCGEREEAGAVFERALSAVTCPEYVCTECYEAHYGLGIYHLCNGNRQDAGVEFDNALRIKPANLLCKKMREMV